MSDVVLKLIAENEAKQEGPAVEAHQCLRATGRRLGGGVCEDVSVAGLLDGVFAKHIQNPKQLLEAGEIEEALRMMPETTETIMLLGQIRGAEREFLQGLFNEKEFGAVKNRVLAATVKLL
jgi:hypothetical protein